MFYVTDFICQIDVSSLLYNWYAFADGTLVSSLHVLHSAEDFVAKNSFNIVEDLFINFLYSYVLCLKWERG